MDLEKTGIFIATLRKDQNMTQKDLAEKIQVTDKAISRWETGKGFPDVSILQQLSEVLDVSISEIVKGEKIAPDHKEELEVTVKEVISHSKNHIAQKTRSVKAKAIIACMSVCAMLLFALLSIWHPVIFQRGNPIPYLIAASKINDTAPYIKVLVDDFNQVFISRRGECPELFSYIEESMNAAFSEQAGGAYIFTTQSDQFAVASQVYFAEYTVWEIPNNTLSNG